jgi:GDPmannose 4,6-dehydratase
MWLMLQQERPKDYVIGTNTAYTVKDLCEVAFSCVGRDWREHVESDVHFQRPTEIAAARGDYSKAKAELGWTPRTHFQELIKLMVDEDIRRLSKVG